MTNLKAEVGRYERGCDDLSTSPQRLTLSSQAKRKQSNPRLSAPPALTTTQPLPCHQHECSSRRSLSSAATTSLRLLSCIAQSCFSVSCHPVNCPFHVEMSSTMPVSVVSEFVLSQFRDMCIGLCRKGLLADPLPEPPIWKGSNGIPTKGIGTKNLTYWKSKIVFG